MRKMARTAQGSLKPLAARAPSPGSLSNLMRDAAPSVPVSFFNQPTLVSKRVGCIVLRPFLDLTAACLK
jgi:hypothetical protein